MEPNNPEQYDSREEEVIDWYKHYMSIKINHLAEIVASRAILHLLDGEEISEPLQMAAADRRKEILREINSDN